MPAGEEVFKYHGYSGPCPKSPLPKAVEPGEKLTAQPFEAYPKLAAHIERMAWNGVGSMTAWGSFLRELNDTIAALQDERDEAKEMVGVSANLSLRSIKHAEAVEAENVELRKIVHVPGQWRCAKCKFVVHKMVMCASTGNVGLKADTKTEPCPNGCGPLWPVTWKEDAFQCGERLVEQHDKIKELEASARTPGTVEVCSLCNGPVELGKSVGAIGNCPGIWRGASQDHERCPLIKSAKPGDAT